MLSSTLCVIFAFLALFAVNGFKGFWPQSTQRAAKARKEILKSGHYRNAGLTRVSRNVSIPGANGHISANLVMGLPDR